MKKVVTIGGGTGHYTLLRGLKNYDIDLSAIVSITDNGGSSGRLMTEFGILPPGDIRNCLVALAEEAKLKDLRDLFSYRFPKDSGELGGHSLGNLILTALTKQHGDIGKAVKIVEEILEVEGKVIPVSLDKTSLKAKTRQGKILDGQVEVSYPNKDSKIEKLWLEPNANIYKDAAKKIRESNLIVICPGDLYGSILPNFLVKGINNALEDSNAKIVYVCNLVTKQGNYGFKARDFVKEIEDYSGIEVDNIICNTKKPTKKVVDKYKEELSYFVDPDIEREGVIKKELLEEYKTEEKIIARHNPKKTARIIMDLI